MSKGLLTRLKFSESGIVRWSVWMSVLILCAYAPVLAQKDSVKTVQEDRSLLVPRYPEKASLDQFREDRDYHYEDHAVPPGNPLEKWIDWLRRQINAFFESKMYVDFWQYLIMVVTGLLVFYILYKAKVLAYLFPSKSTGAQTEYMVGQENIHEIQFEEAIAQALGQRDFRLAIRLQYLKILKLLTVKELIHWKPNLTNQSYVQELERTVLHHDFVEITKFFEFTWYGDFDVRESGFEEMKEFSDSFVKRIGV